VYFPFGATEKTMAKHTLKEILGIFATHAGHTHEAAVQATYDAGHAAGS
jgi:hypothetical protein